MSVAIKNARVVLCLCTVVFLACVAMAQNGSSNSGDSWKDVEQAMGRSGQMQPGGVMKFSMPRKDLRVKVKGVDIKPGLALGSWAAFMRNGQQGMVMGDLVLTEDEIAPVMQKLESEEVQVSALHNHLLGESPRVMYMHIASHGDPVRMAKAIHDALALTKTPQPDAAGSQAMAELGLDQKQIEQILGRAGKVNGGVLQFSVPRGEQITDAGMSIPPSMGVATAINFQSTAGGKAATTGDFVLLANEVNPVIQALTSAGIEVTALHSHMLNEQPRLFFMHFWANDEPAKLAKAMRSALDATNSKK